MENWKTGIRYLKFGIRYLKFGIIYWNMGIRYKFVISLRKWSTLIGWTQSGHVTVALLESERCSLASFCVWTLLQRFASCSNQIKNKSSHKKEEILQRRGREVAATYPRYRANSHKVSTIFSYRVLSWFVLNYIHGCYVWHPCNMYHRVWLGLVNCINMYQGLVRVL